MPPQAQNTEKDYREFCNWDTIQDDDACIQALWSVYNHNEI